MADKREFTALTQAVREAKLAAKIADLPKGLRKMAAILSEARGQVRSEMARGYLTGLTDLVEALEEIPPRLWRQGIAEIESIMRFASADDLLGDEDKQALQQTTNSLKSEISRQSGLAVRTGNVLARGVKRLGEGALERGAGYYGRGGIFVWMASKLALSAVERRRETREAGKQFARVRSTALGAAASERSYSSRFADTEDTSPRRTGGDVEVEQLGELKKINKTLVQQIKVAQDIDAGEDREDVLRESRAAYVSGEAAIESPKVMVDGKPTVIDQTKTKDSGFWTKLLSGVFGAFTNILPLIKKLGLGITTVTGALGIAGGGGLLLALAELTGALYIAKKALDFFGGNDARKEIKNRVGDVVEQVAGKDVRNLTTGPGIPVEKGTQKGLGEFSAAMRSIPVAGRVAQTAVENLATRPGASRALTNIVNWASKSPRMATAAKIGGGMFSFAGRANEALATASAWKKLKKVRERENYAFLGSKESLLRGVSVGLHAGGTLAGPIGGIIGGVGGGALDEKIDQWYPESTTTSTTPMRIEGNKEKVATEILSNAGYSPNQIVGIMTNLKQENANLDENKEVSEPGSERPATGIAQWSEPGRRKRMMEYVASRESTVGKFQAQVEYVAKEMKEMGLGPKELPNDRRAAADAVLTRYERPSEANVAARLAMNAKLLGGSAPAQGASLSKPTPSFSRNASPVASQSSAAAGRGANVNVISAPNVAPVVVNQNGGGTTFVPMPIRTEPIENTLLAITRLNYV